MNKLFILGSDRLDCPDDHEVDAVMRSAKWHKCKRDVGVEKEEGRD